MSGFCASSDNTTDLLHNRHCHLDFLNTSIFAGYAYITVLILLYLRCSKRK